MKRNYEQCIYLDKKKDPIKKGEKNYNIRVEKGCGLMIDNENKVISIQGLKTNQQRKKIMELMDDLFDKKEDKTKQVKSKKL